MMDAAMEMAKRNGCTFFEVVGTNKYVTKICTRRKFTLVKSIKYEGNGDSKLMRFNINDKEFLSAVDTLIMTHNL